MTQGNGQNGHSGMGWGSIASYELPSADDGLPPAGPSYAPTSYAPAPPPPHAQAQAPRPAPPPGAPNGMMMPPAPPQGPYPPQQSYAVPYEEPYVAEVAVEPSWQEPGESVGGFPNEGSHMLGLSLLSMVTGGTVGGYYGGWSGGIAGALAGGAVTNGIRAAARATDGTEAGDREAQVSLVYALVSAGLAGLAWFKLRPAVMDAKRNPTADDEHPCPVPPRRVGP